MTDILLTDYDLETGNGDFLLGDPTYQNQELLLLSQKGEWKENPTIGVGISNYLLDEGKADLLRDIRIEFNRDGMKVEKISMDAKGKLLIAASYDN